MLRCTSSLPCLTTRLSTPLKPSCHIRTVKQLTPAQKYNQRLQEAKIKTEGKQPAPKYAFIPCIDATKLVREPSKKKQGKPKVYRKKLRFVKQGMDNIHPYYIPSERSPMYTVIQQVRNMFEYSRRESEKQASIHSELDTTSEEKKDDMEADLRKYMMQPEGMMSKKEAKLAAKTAKKITTATTTTTK